MRVRVYIDGFNLYHGCLKDTPYRWLDCRRLCENMSRDGDEIVYIKYFASPLRKLPRDKNSKKENQATYWRALRTLKRFKIIEGFFQKKTYRTGFWIKRRGRYLREKRTDVNLATCLLHDAHLDRFDLAILISSDNDFTGVVRVVTKRLGKRVGVFSPFADQLETDLCRSASFARAIPGDVLRRSLFARDLEDAAGEFHMPAGWDQAQ